MFKRFFSFFMPLLLVLGLLPVSAFASEVNPDDGVMPAVAYVDYNRSWTGFPDFTFRVDETYAESVKTVLLQKEETGQTFVVAFYGTDDTSYQKAVINSDGDFEIMSYGVSDDKRTEGKFRIYTYELREMTPSTGDPYLTWSLTYNASPTGYYSMPLVTDFLSSDVDIYDEAGEVVFQQAPLLWRVTEAELKGNSLPRIMRAFSILTLCGVGLMASLLLCPLLLKVLRRFLG